LSNKIIKCECGAEIFGSDLPALRKAIDAHAETHRKVLTDCSKTQAANEGEADLEVSCIKEDLLKKASKISNSP
jgi:hypothetical protein